jgi:N-acetylglutamate synthase/N-acetylornithine aminotransferase
LPRIPIDRARGRRPSNPVVVRSNRTGRAEIEIDLGAGFARSSLLGADLTHEYVSENADYRS